MQDCRRMQLNEAIPIISVILGVITLFIGAIARDRTMQRQYAEDKERFIRELAIIRETYVPKNDLKDHIAKMELSLDRLHTRLDDLLKMRIKEGA